MRRRALIALAVLSTLPAACGDGGEETTPVACLEGAGPYLRALESARRPVRLPGGVAISDCLTENQGAGDLTRVGAILLRVTTTLNAEARSARPAAATVRLGYLIGAVDRGAERTGGIHAELARRLEGAALFSPAGKPPPPPFDQRYRRGYDAGRDSG